MNRIKKYQACETKRNEIIEKINLVLKTKAEIDFAFLYGSFQNEPYFRDIDIGIFVNNLDSSEYWNYECDLSQKIENVLETSYPVEIKVINKAPLSFCFNVIRGKLLFARDEAFLVDFMIGTARDYLDIAPLRYRYMMEAMA